MQALNKELNSLENHDEHLKNLQNQYELEKVNIYPVQETFQN